MDLDERAHRVRRLLALEIDRILRHLAERRDFLVQIWSRHRAREPFLETIYSRYRTLSFTDLALLDEAVIEAIEPFYEALSELGMYVRYTEDMPTTLADALDEHIADLGLLGVEALSALGVELGPPRDPVLRLVE